MKNTTCNATLIANGVSTTPQTGYQSGTGWCNCGCSAAEYYKHPITGMHGGAKKSKKAMKGGDCSLSAPQPVATEGMQNGAVLYGGKRGRGRPRKQTGGAGCSDAKSLIPVSPSTPADLSGQGPFTDQHANWREMGTGSGVPEKVVHVSDEAFSSALETSGGARRSASKKSATKKRSSSKKPAAKKTASKKKTTKKQKGGDIDEVIEKAIHAIEQAGGEKKRGRGRPRKQAGGGSDWVMTAHSRGPINYPDMSEAQFRAFNKNSPMISNADLYWAPLKSPMFNTKEPVGANFYNPQ